jgi:hypothetical protein
LKSAMLGCSSSEGLRLTNRVRGRLLLRNRRGSIKVQSGFPSVLFGIVGAVRAVCFLRVTGARLPFTAVTRLQMLKSHRVANKIGGLVESPLHWEQ